VSGEPNAPGRLRAWFAARRPWPPTIPTPRLALAIAAVAWLWALPGRAGIIGGLAGLSIVAVAAAVDWVWLPPRRALSVERSLAPTVGVGDTVEGAYTVGSHWPKAVRVQLADELPSGVRGSTSRAPTVIPPRSEKQLPFSVVGIRRGRFPLGPVAVRTTTPLGLLQRRVLLTPNDSVLVAPSVTGVRRFRLLAIRHRLEAAGMRQIRQRGEGRAFAGLREYVVGDDPRHIDWKATARRQKHIVREYSIEQSQTVLLLLESGRAMTQLAGEFSRFEHALSASLVLTDVASTAGDRTGALVFDDEVRAFVPPQRGAAALRGIRDALIPVMPTLIEPDYAGAFRFLSTRLRRRALIVFFTDVLDVRASRALIAHVTRSAVRHLVVVVALRNDALFAAATPSVDRELPLFESAVAEELLMGRQQALEQMRRAGVAVLDVSPLSMSAAVVNRYLEIKGRGAL
jgi:uncharacterized protein (DUF58 family)